MFCSNMEQYIFNDALTLIFPMHFLLFKSLLTLEFSGAFQRHQGLEGVGGRAPPGFLRGLCVP